MSDKPETKTLSEESRAILAKATKSAQDAQESARIQATSVMNFASSLVAEREGLDGAWSLDVATGVATKQVVE